MKLQTSAPRNLWRSLEEREGQSSGCADEFPEGASEWQEGLDRRAFLKLIGASLALGASAACTKLPLEEIVPYVHQPEFLVPGIGMDFASAMTLGGEGIGVLARSHEGRPTKIEGNPEHPASRGRSSVFMQAELLNLYHPQRSKAVEKHGRSDTWENLLGEITARTAEWKTNAGAGVHLLTRRIASPTLREQIARFLKTYPRATCHEHDPAFPINPQPATVMLADAEVIVSLDADFFSTSALGVRAAGELAKRRKGGANRQARIYAVESMPGLMGAMADHRLALAPSAFPEFARHLANAASGAVDSDPWMNALVRDLEAHRGKCVIVAGDFQPAAVHDSARAANEALGNIGQTIQYLPSAPRELPPGSLKNLTDALQARTVKALFIFGGNPVYDAPADLRFDEALAKAAFTVHLGLHPGETATRCQWHVPESHFLESWSDAQSFDGSLAIVQPLIEPLYASRSAHELMAALLEEIPTTGYEILRAAWQARGGFDDFEHFWRKTLHDGVVAAPQGTPPALVAAANDASSKSSANAGSESARPRRGLELVIRPDPYLLDGRFSENAWLQELPKPLTRLTWENAAHISRRTAAKLGLEHGDVVELRYQGRSVVAPIFILPGHADECVTVHFGHGRAHSSQPAEALGFNAFTLQSEAAPWGGPGLEIRKTGARHTFSTTQEHQSMEGRAPVHVATLGKPAPDGEWEPAPSPDETLYPEVEYGRPAWGMVIDLNSCIGCSVCTIACQAENNIPVVGRAQVMHGREMHWIRVDRYYDGEPDEPRMLHQPVPCMHCEKAPCEVVCPVAATVHDHEGLNVMVYNRCIGTRYCSNNCPYKVRRFNFFQFTDEKPATLKMMRNPDVTVRMRGVMEKCSYCVQRISAGRIAAEKENRPIRDGEVTPACAQACPTEAIAFGDIHDPQSRVAALRKKPLHYALMAELNTRPRTTYLARVFNPNPGIA